ncbi:MAG: glycosyltransferase family 1 protein [Vicinamibacteria bacterium]
MILAYDGSSLAQGLSGVGYYTRRLLDELVARASDGRLAAPVVLSNKPVTVPAGARLHEGHRFPVRAVWMETCVPRALDAIGADLAHFTNYTAPLRLDRPYVVTIHDMSLSLLPACSTWKMRLIVPRVLPRVARRARLVLVPSVATRDDVVRLLRVDPGRVRVIPHAAPRAFAAAPEAPAPGGPPYFLFVGNLEPRKNLARALRAFARIAPTLPDQRFVIAGQPGWKYDDVLQELRRPGLESRVELRGYVAEDELPALYRHATAFVYPSLYEGFGLPVIEAMACGAPVLTSCVSALPELAEGAAVLVDPYDEAALAEGMHALASDAAMRERLRAAGRARAAQYSWEATADRTVEAYEEARGR